MGLLRFLVDLVFAPVRLLFPALLVTETITVPVQGLEKQVNIVQISDIHYDRRAKRITDQMMNEVINRTNDLNPDLILLTGDYVQLDPQPVAELSARFLSKLRAPLGTIAVLGNHDYRLPHSKQMIIESLAQVGITVLDNSSVDPFGSGRDKLRVVGLGDFSCKDFKPNNVESVLEEDEQPKLVLSHNPDTAQILAKYRVDLQLSGHTHGGQIALPYIGPLIPYVSAFFSYFPKKIKKQIPGTHHLNVVKNWAWISGFHKVVTHPNGATNYLYVSRGLATHPPLRLFCHPEITLIHLVPASEEQKKIR